MAMAILGKTNSWWLSASLIPLSLSECPFCLLER
jgi:hypothetical protein